MKYKLNDFKVLPGSLPPTFKEAVKMLTRPYEAIPEKTYNKLLARLEESKSDFFLYKGKVVTIGNADGGFAIMPLRNQ